uniref:NUMOD1 domain protein n=1 Tax=Marseillevirus LCMAC101 TaxID=2506602 RepID=A0A481YSF7_9VIRU|nr:MAG: hypothetical protein LCMAC101_07980 [Marseillevirus LCMAC101]
MTGEEWKNFSATRPARKCPNKVDRIDKKGKIIKTYDGAGEASLDLGISDKSIHRLLRGDTKKTKDGYLFKYH